MLEPIRTGSGFDGWKNLRFAKPIARDSTKLRQSSFDQLLTSLG
ncbi:hypothetical protein RSK20926_14519 [Roseobacter sp. SK209-2-6]|nr:hypothetical protein RSK20926_14519 [Roseobacter sp. SK209-2-6]